tara:strand:- start:333 stop:893 length:561 start_codon:yes stop_codon:yes gene_type:complete
MDQVIRKYPPQDRQKGATMNAFALTGNDWNDANGPCCGVLACAIATQTKFKDAWAWFKGKHRYCASNRWKGCTWNHWYKDYLDHAGVKYDYLYDVKLRQKGWHKKTLINFYRTVAKEDTCYLISTTGHAQVLYNGKVVDQRGVMPITQYWGKLKKIDNIYVIHGIDKDNINNLVFGLPLFDAANKQ